MNNGRVTIFDTTLRDGEQSPGASMNVKEKLRVAEALLRLKVDVIEAGFPISSPVAFEAFREISALVGAGARIAALARCLAKDIDCAGEALVGTVNPRIHVFCATSPIHREHKLRLSCSGVLERVHDSVLRAKNALGPNGDVEFSLEDASRTEREFIAEVAGVAIEAGATTINLPDTVGYGFPSSYGSLFANLRRDLPAIDIDGIILSAHCHNDLGMAVGNSFEAVVNGARQVECTLNGIGERAGNAQLEAFVMAVLLHGEKLGIHTGVETAQIFNASNTLSRTTGLPLARHTPIIGRNAFAHESGIHQDGMLKERTTYEIMRPEDVGRSGTDLVLGRHSGRSGLTRRLKDLGISLTTEELDRLFVRFKELADQRNEVHDEDLYALIAALNGAHAAGCGAWSLMTYSIESDTDGVHRGRVELLDPDGASVSRFGSGDGPLDALTAAIRDAVDIQGISQAEWNARSVGTGEDALGEAHVTLMFERSEYRGTGADTDSIKASLIAYLQAMNAIVRSMKLTTA